MKKLLVIAVLGSLALPLAPLLAGDEDDDTSSPRAALEALNDFIGHWKGDGAPDQPQPDPNEAWKETVNWSWRFKGDDAWLVMTVNNGKYLRRGELRFLPATKRYQLTATTADGKQVGYEGVLKDHILTLEHVDPATQEVQRLKMNSAADGIRFIYRGEHKPADRTLFAKDFLVACTKEGESLAAREKKIECIVTGGLGTIPVSYKGITYYVCCTGCKQAFEENPEKILKEAAKRKARGD